MRKHWFTLYCRLAVAALLAFVFTLYSLSPSPTVARAEVESSDRPELAPRIAAWMERMEEEKEYEEKAARLDAEAEEKAAAARLASLVLQSAGPSNPIASEPEKKSRPVARASKPVRRAPPEPQMALGYAAEPPRSSVEFPRGVVNWDSRIPR